MKKSFLTSIFFILIYNTAMAQVKLANIFSDHMVLQRNQKINIWGKASSGESITTSFYKQTKTTKADANGNWLVKLDAEMAGGPYVLKVNNISLKDILVGDVWICSGQSNMEWPLNQANNAAEEIKAANYTQIRHVEVPKNIALQTKEDILPTSWKICTPKDAAAFTAVGYFFARKLNKELNVPIGLIHTSWGGTNIETWISNTALKTNNDYQKFASDLPNNVETLNASMKVKTFALLNVFENGNIKADDIALWKEINYDDAHWSFLQVPKLWEEQGLPNLDAVVWLRKEIILTAEQANEEVILDLGKIDDSDETYVNGELVGSTINKWNELRKYKIKKGLLKAGKNIIAVKVTDTGGGGGIYGDPETVKISFGTASQSLVGNWKARVDTAIIESGIGPNSFPSLLYNGMIYPINNFSIKGAIWYQGESNAYYAYQYQTTFPLLINSWRNEFKQGDFPFYFAQLASFNANNQNGLTGSQWAELREAQTKTLALKNTGMAVTTDIGNPTDIHPTNKQDVGLRLALQALNKTYAKKILSDGPTFQSMEIKKDKVIVYVKNIGKGLLAKGNDSKIIGFQIAGADKVFYWANAIIENNTIVISSNDVKTPVAVRFAWVDDASNVNLFNKDGLPAVPFRTDNWEGLTFTNRYAIP